MKREEALCYLKENLHNENLVKHSIAVEWIMEALAEHFGEDRDLWSTTGLLHDIDYDQTAKDPDKHSRLGADMLAERGMSPEMVHAVLVHNEAHGLPRETLLDKALYAADPLAGLIVAGALVHPDKRLESLDTEFIVKRFGEKAFAKGADRQQIASCTEMDLNLEEFIAIGLTAMQRHADELGLGG